MFLYVEQDVNLAQQSSSGLKNFKIALKNVKNSGKRCFAVRKEWAKNFPKIFSHGFVLPADQIIPSGEEMWAAFEHVADKMIEVTGGI